MKKLLILLLTGSISFSGTVLAQTKTKAIDPPGLSFIKESDLKSDLYGMADAHFKGRSGGTLDELKASAWFATRMQEAGVLPAGDDGTYFQFFSLKRSKISNASTISIGTQTLKLWKDVLVAQTIAADVTLPVVYLGKAGSYNLSSVDVKGKAVMLQSSPEGIQFRSLPEWRYSREVMVKYGNDLVAKGAAAIIFIADEYGEKSWPYAMNNFMTGSFGIEGPAAPTPANPAARTPVLWLHTSALTWITQPGLTLNANIQLDNFTYPSVNIVGKVEGKDPVLSKEYVLLSGHPMHWVLET